MRIDPLDYYEESEWLRFMSASEKYQSPFLLVDLGIVRKNYLSLKDYFPFANVYYAVKANPGRPVLELLRDLGSCFDVASIYELDLLLKLGVDPARVSYGNTIKKALFLTVAYCPSLGINCTLGITAVRSI